MLTEKLCPRESLELASLIQNNTDNTMFNRFLVITAVAVSTILLPLQVSLADDLKWNQTKAEIELKPGENEAKAEFILTNNGQNTVQIDHIKTSCGCTGSILDQKKVKPGESTTIVGTFKKGNRQGLNHNRLQVFLKGQTEPVETLHMLVRVPRLVDANPSIVYWNRSSAKKERKVQIKLDKRYLNAISHIEYDPKLISVTEKKDPEGNFERILTILPKSFDQQLRHTVLIKATGDNNLTAETKLQVFVQP